MAEMKGRKKRLPLTLSFLTLSDTKKQTSAHKTSRIFEEPNGVVGLGILAALDGDPHHQNLTFTIGSRTAVLPVSPKSASNPIPILGNKNASENNICEKLSAEKMEFCEGYTCVISHLGNNQMKREYFGGEILGNNNGSSTVSVVSGNGGLPAAVYDSPVTGGGDTAAVGVAGFLSSCFLCKKMLHGLDVFMYRGEKAFCSAECRHRQISIDEKKEKRRSGVRRSIKYSVSPCSVVAA